MGSAEQFKTYITEVKYGRYKYGRALAFSGMRGENLIQRLFR
jgi:hypothetical protein